MYLTRNNCTSRGIGGICMSFVDFNLCYRSIKIIADLISTMSSDSVSTVRQSDVFLPLYVDDSDEESEDYQEKGKTLTASCMSDTSDIPSGCLIYLRSDIIRY